LPLLDLLDGGFWQLRHIWAYLENPEAKLEHAQQMAAHSDPKTTRLYDRRNDEVTMDEVERIGI